MNIKGIIRRVDELGRIVIPVEIRRVVGIKVGENLEFNVLNQEIILKKTSCINNNEIFFNEIFNDLSELIDGNVIITDREKIFKSRDKNLRELQLPKEIENLLSQHEELYEINIPGFINSTLYIYPYYQENDIAGFIILYNILSEDKYRKLLKYICKLIHDKLSL